jgi:uncharacterized damage-inducible protein DinB
MTTAAPATLPEVEVFRHQAGMIRQVLRLNVEGVSQEESLIQPQPAGNCLNFVVGHVVWTYSQLLPLLGQEMEFPEGVKRYARGAPPVTGASEATELGELLAAWDQASQCVDDGLAALKPEKLDDPAPGSPTGNPNETVRSLLTTVFFHQAYHVGQTGVLRRVAGKPGAIA